VNQQRAETRITAGGSNFFLFLLLQTFQYHRALVNSKLSALVTAAVKCTEDALGL